MANLKILCSITKFLHVFPFSITPFHSQQIPTLDFKNSISFFFQLHKLPILFLSPSSKKAPKAESNLSPVLFPTPFKAI